MSKMAKIITQEDYFLRVQKEAKRCKDKLTEKSAKILLSLNLPGLKKKGIKRIAFQYEMFNQYPPHFLLKTISEKEIFSDGNLLEQKEEKEPFALYVHLPFCVKKCTFCFYFSISNCRKKYIENYLSYLKKEIKLLSKKRYLQLRKVSSIYWGGGTPTLLEERQITALMGYLKDNFEIMPNAEITCETTPEAAKMRKIECLLKNGFNRLSIGVQVFNDDLLKSYGRLYTSKKAIDVFKMSQMVGFRHINIDLMFGLAGQSPSIWKKSLEITEDLMPTNVTTYPFLDTRDVSVMSKKSKEHLPSEEERLLMHTMAIERFVDSGYVQICPYQFISSWEYPYRQQEHKAKSSEIYALGVSGHSFINNVDFHNCRSLPNYYQILEKGRLPIERGRKLNIKEQMIRFVVMGLQKTSGINREKGGVDKALFQRMFGLSVNEIFKKELEVLKNIGLISESGRYIHLTYLGLLYPQETSLFFYLKKDKKKISQPIK